MDIVLAIRAYAISLPSTPSFASNTSSGISASSICGVTSLEALFRAAASRTSSSEGNSAQRNSISVGVLPAAACLKHALCIVSSVNTINFLDGFRSINRKSISERNFMNFPVPNLLVSVFSRLVDIQATIDWSVFTASNSNSPPAESSSCAEQNSWPKWLRNQVFRTQFSRRRNRDRAPAPDRPPNRRLHRSHRRRVRAACSGHRRGTRVSLAPSLLPLPIGAAAVGPEHGARRAIRRAKVLVCGS